MWLLKCLRCCGPLFPNNRSYRMKLLVTGGAGFIGSHLCEALLRRGDSLIVIDDLNPLYSVADKESNLAQISRGGSVTFRRLDITERDGVWNVIAETKP